MYPFGNPTNPFEWIRKIPSEDRLWARTYLANENLQPAYHAFEPGGPGFGNPADPNHLKIDLRLRNAWRQRKARKRQSDKVACNFLLNKLSKRRLEKIAEEQNSTLVETLESLINGETEKLRELKEKVKKTKQSIAAVEEKHSKELLKAEESHEARRHTLRAAEDALHLQTMKLVIAELRLEKPEAQGANLEHLKDEAVQRFGVAWGRAREDIPYFKLGLMARFPDALKIFGKINTNDFNPPDW